MIDREGFARALLDVLGAPATPSNVAFLVAWMAREGTSAAFNPLATTLNYGANTRFNSVGVRNYADLATGVEATRRTLVGGGYYSRIVAHLRAGDGVAAANEGDELGTWSGGGYRFITIPHQQPPGDDDVLTPAQEQQLAAAANNASWLAGVDPSTDPPTPTGHGIPRVEKLLEAIAGKLGVDLTQVPPA